MKRNWFAPKNETELRGNRGSPFASMRESDRPNVVQVGDTSAPIGDLYHSLIRMSWPRFIALFVLVFLFLNLIFAVLYTLDPSGLRIPSSDRAMQFTNAFFFSVHTIATVGYGNMYPIDLFTNVIAAIEITSGLLLFALGSGLTFARFSRPTARVLFSNIAVVTNFQNLPTLMVRAANQRNNFLFEANVRCSLVRRETIDGKEIWRVYI